MDESTDELVELQPRGNSVVTYGDKRVRSINRKEITAILSPWPT